MKLFKPAWVNHDGNPIFSVDIHPDGTRFATGGQGPEKCGRVIIWNMSPILNPTQEEKKDVPRKLCQMDNHLACINCVRWSNNGRYLASAGDDKNLMVWQMAGRVHHHSSSANHQAQSHVFESANIEQWRCIATLNGHNGDILDLGWSHNDQYLASCSVDNMIIVWDATNFPQVVTKITEHTGLVKGVSWDPTGKYLASQSDDKTLRVWRTSDWREETIVREPFKACGGTTHVLRLNWSPDGQILVSAHAMNNNGSVAQLIDRDGWKADKDLVGHRKAVTCVRFNPNILYEVVTKKQAQHSERTNNINIGNNSNSNGTSSKANATSKSSNSLTSKTIKYCSLAVGSRDRSISVWLTSRPRPLIVIHDLFESSVLDISWSRDGYRLIACSQDGSIAVMIFSPSDLGNKLTPEEKQAHFQKLYGKSITSNPTSSKTLIAEDPELLKAQQQIDVNQKHREMLDQQNSHSNSVSQNGFNGCESNTSLSGLSKGPTDRQIETVLPGGKRRITPLYLQPPMPFTSSSNITFSSSKDARTKITIETNNSNAAPTPTPSLAPPTPTKVSQFAAIRREMIAPKSSLRILHPSKIDKATVFRIKDRDGRELLLEAENDSIDKLNEIRLLDSGNNKLWDILVSSKINSVIATETLVACSCTDNSLHLFGLLSGRRLVPPIILDSPVAHIAAEKDHLLVITSSAQMWLWNITLNKVLIKAESVSCILSSSNIPSTEKPQPSIKAQSKSADKLANKSEDQNQQANNNANQDSDMEILSCSMTEHYQPLVLLSTGRAFVFDFNMHCWMLISDTTDSISRLSNCKPSLAAVKRFLSNKEISTSEDHSSLKRSLPLTLLQSQHSFDLKRFANNVNYKNGSETLQVRATRSYLDQQLASALAIRSSHEFHYWLIQSVQHYADTGAESRLKDLCSRLMSSFSGEDDSGRSDSSRPNGSSSDGDIITNTATTEDSHHVLGLSKRSLLKDVLAIISKDLRYQRLYSEYKQLLDYDPTSSVSDIIMSMDPINHNSSLTTSKTKY